MLIGEIARISGLSRDTIRFYEKRKFFQVKRTESEWNNYKDYDQEVLSKLLLIKKCKGFGFSLNEIGEILILVENEDATCKVMFAKGMKKLSDIETKIRELEQLKSSITDKFKDSVQLCRSNPNTSANCSELTIVNKS